MLEDSLIKWTIITTLVTSLSNTESSYHANLKYQMPVVLGRPFLATGNAQIFVSRVMKVSFSNKKLSLNMCQASQHPHGGRLLSNRCQLGVGGVSTALHSGRGTSRSLSWEPTLVSRSLILIGPWSRSTLCQNSHLWRTNLHGELLLSH